MFKENIATRINFNRPMHSFLNAFALNIPAELVHNLDRGPSAEILPTFMQGHLYDAFGGAAIGALFSFLPNSSSRFKFSFLMGFIVPSIEEIGQGLGIFPGTFDLGDFAAFAAGSLAWVAIDKSAEFIYKSGLTQPIYKTLGIDNSNYFT